MENNENLQEQENTQSNSQTSDIEASENLNEKITDVKTDENKSSGDAPCKSQSRICIGQMMFNICAGIAILVAFLLLFLTKNKSEVAPAASNSSVRVAYVCSDSVLTQYLMVLDLNAELTKLNDSLEADLKTRGQIFQAKVNAYQQNMQNGKITTVDQAKQQENALQAEQDQLMGLSEQYTNIVAVKQNSISIQIIDSVSSIIKDYPEEFPYDIVFGYSQGAGILYISEQMDITTKVIEKLNKNYSK